MCEAYLEVRRQPAKGTWPRQGPDTYVAVQVVPSGKTRLAVLNHKAAANRGIKLVHCGEGYSDRQATTRSALGAALERAQRLVDNINDQADLFDDILS
jgi:hypothetical protein